MITPELEAAIVSHAVAAHPHECCGLLGSTDHLGTGTITSIYAATNASARPTEAYVISPTDQHAIEAEVMARGERIAAVYHSHPTGPAEPSGVDLMIAKLHPDVALVIVNVDRDELRLFRLVGGDSFQELDPTNARPIEEASDAQQGDPTNGRSDPSRAGRAAAHAPERQPPAATDAADATDQS